MGIKNIFANINLIRSLPVVCAYKFSKNKKLIEGDIDRWVEIQHLDNIKHSKVKSLNWLLVYSKEFRNLFYRRLDNRLISMFLGFLYPKLNSLYLSTKNIGKGLFIVHGFSTIIVAQRIGENCRIYQQVTIGYRNNPISPIIGNNVLIGAGAIVIGDITIGDNSTIAAGAVVTKDVPPNSVVVGNPAILVNKDGVKVNQPL